MISRRRLRRRTTLAAAALAPAFLASCDIDPPREEAPRSEDDAPTDADSLLVASVLGEILSAEAVLAAASGATPALRRRLEPLAASHAAHRALLTEAAPEVTTDPVDPVDLGGADAVLGAVRRSEARLQRVALRACVDAASGDLARVLASVAASTSQHLAALDATTRTVS